MEENQKIIDICVALAPGRPIYRDGVLIFKSLNSDHAVISIVQGFSDLVIFENGSWHISGEARSKVLKLMNKIHSKAAKVLEDEKNEAASKYAKTVVENNRHVLDVLSNPEEAIRLRQD